MTAPATTPTIFGSPIHTHNGRSTTTDFPLGEPVGGVTQMFRVHTQENAIRRGYGATGPSKQYVTTVRRVSTHTDGIFTVTTYGNVMNYATVAITRTPHARFSRVKLEAAHAVGVEAALEFVADGDETVTRYLGEEVEG